MYWRVNTNKEYKEGRGMKNKNQLEKLVQQGYQRELVEKIMTSAMYGVRL